jgi:hypothetical protein
MDGGARCYFSLTLSSDAVGQNKQPTVRAGSRRRTGDAMSKIVLVPRAHAARIGEFREFKIQHRRAKGTIKLQTQRQPLKGQLKLKTYGIAKQVAEKLFEAIRSSPQALKRKHIFSSLTARLEVVPFPFPGEGDFFRSL